ncbi:MAG: MucB/RseB C-terminal domain-containing protein [Oceanococcus sp.]
MSFSPDRGLLNKSNHADARPMFVKSCTFLALGLVPFLAHADALDWLQKMNQAVRDTTYSGTAVYRDGKELETLRIYHRFLDGQETERIHSLSGEMREVLRNGDQLTCILPDQKSVVTDHKGLPGLLPKLSRTAFEDLGEFYDMIAVASSSRVAGRACREVQIRARDIYRYDYALCLDESTFVPLDIRLMDERGQLLEQVVFTEIDYPESIADELLQARTDTRGFSKVHQQKGQEQAVSQSVVPQGVWELQDLPAGFRLATREQEMWPGFEGPVTQMLYSDGLATVSVFATPQRISEDALQGLTQVGGVSAYGRMMNDHHITVVGEVPQATVRFFGDNLRFSKLP